MMRHSDAFPPYIVDGGLLCGTVYVFYQRPPSPDDLPSFNGWLLGWELACIILSAGAAYVGLRSNARPYQRNTLLVGAGLALPFLAFCLPEFESMGGPEFTW